MQCSHCGTELPPTSLSCPVCHALAHATRLQALAAQADAHAAAGDLTGALAAWRDALTLLPPRSVQYGQVAARVDELSRRVVRDPSAARGQPGSRTQRGVLATLGGLALAFLGKAKFLLAGLSKAGTLLTMLLSFGAYWTLFGWPFAAGLVLSIYIHEMGHVAALRRFGVRTGVPTFLPGIGAVIRLRQHFANAAEDARVGLAGPIWGLGAALAAVAVYELNGQPIWAAIATTGAWINLFNLLPVWQLDGGRAFRALRRSERFIACGVLAGLFALTHDGLLALIALAAAWRAFDARDAGSGDRSVLVQYAALAIALALLTKLLVTTGSPLPAP